MQLGQPSLSWTLAQSCSVTAENTEPLPASFHRVDDSNRPASEMISLIRLLLYILYIIVFFSDVFSYIVACINYVQIEI